MDSLSQELIDKIIDDLPRSSLLPCSLVAKRWRRRSQRRAFQEIKFFSEGEVDYGCTGILRDPDGIASYVHAVRFEGINSWNDPATFGRALKNLGSLTTLWVTRTEIPDELPDQILSLPNLKVLRIMAAKFEPKEPLPTHPAPPQKGPLDWLELRGDVSGLGETLAKSRLTSRRLSLALRIAGIEQLIVHSSKTVVELKLYDTFLDDTPRGVIPPVDLPSLTALTTLTIRLCMDDPSSRLTSILCRIPPAPALTSITIQHDAWFDSDMEVEYPFQGRWVEIDRWLAQLARRARAQEGLSVVLARWPEGELVWEGFLHEFRKAGGEIKTDSAAADDEDDGWNYDGSWDDDGHWGNDGRWDNDFWVPWSQ